MLRQGPSGRLSEGVGDWRRLRCLISSEACDCLKSVQVYELWQTMARHSFSICEYPGLVRVRLLELYVMGFKEDLSAVLLMHCLQDYKRADPRP